MESSIHIHRGRFFSNVFSMYIDIDIYIYVRHFYQLPFNFGCISFLFFTLKYTDFEVLHG